MHYKRQLWAWLTAMVLCFVIAAVLGSCSSGGDDTGTGNGGGDDAGTETPTTIAQATNKLVGCGFSGGDALTHRLELDFSVANKQADGVVFPKAAQTYFEKVASAYLACLVAAPCADLGVFYCEQAASGDASTLQACFTAVETKYLSQDPAASFKCTDRTALEDPAKAVCNGIDDCADKSDETSRACALVAHIECDGKSAPQIWRCNNAKQCTDGADEQNCFVCSESEVTPNANRCNGREDCGSGADERECTETFVCPASTNDDAGTGAGDAGDSIDAGSSDDGGMTGDAANSGDAGDAGRLPDGGKR